MRLPCNQYRVIDGNLIPLRLCIVLLIELLFVPPLCAQQVGDTVLVVAASEASLKNDSRIIGAVPRGTSLNVDEISEIGFRVTWGRVNGWISKHDVLPTEAALRYFAQAIASKPRALDYYGRGNAWLAKQQYDSALADFNEAIRLEPTFRKAILARASLYATKEVKGQSAKDYQKAIADYTEAIRLDAKDAEAYRGRGFVFTKIGDSDKAIADYTEAIRLDPKNAWAYVARGCMYAEKGDFDKCIADCTIAIQIDPELAFAYKDRGNCYLEKGKIDNAIEDYTESIRLDPHNAEVYVRRGCACATQGNMQKAVADISTAISLNPDAPCYHEVLGAMQIVLGNYKQGVQSIENAIRLNLTDPAAVFEPWNKSVVTTEAYRHGEQQIRQMLKDRPVMGQFGKKNDELFQWAVRKFGGEDLHKLIFWNGSALPPDTNSMYHFPTAEGHGYIQVRGENTDGSDKTKARSFEEMWSDAVFELYNIANTKQFRRLNDDAIAGKVSKEEYVVKTIELESEAAEKTRSFYIHVFLHWANEHGLATHPRLWYLAKRLDPSRSLILPYIDRKGSYWHYYEYRYDLFIFPSLTKNGEYEKAIALATRLLEWTEIGEEKPRVFAERGRAYAALNQHDKAIANYGESIRLDPSSASAIVYVCRSISYTNLGDLDKAITDANEAIRLMPDYPEAYTARACAFGRKGDLDKAIADCTEAIRLKPKYAMAYYQRAFAYDKKGEVQKAKEDYSQADRLGFKH
jgi:tetratricopeptide (TPR) repeat protein